MNKNDTLIKKAGAKFELQDKVFSIKDAVIKTNIFEIDANGSVGLDLNTELNTMLYVNPDITASLENKLDGLKILCDPSGRITVGGNLKGTIPHLKYKPNKDFRKKTKKFLMQEGGNILGVLFGG